MSLRIYNTLTRRKDEFRPLNPGKIGIYTCGITAYDYCHVGHARSAVVFDVITRFLRYRGFEVTYVKNFTDIDDKIIAKANDLGVNTAAISERFIAEHDRDMDALGIVRPTVTPRATENIDGMIALIERLLEKGHAYVVDGDVYYAVESFPGYGKLSCRNIDEMMAGARVDVDERKRNPLDFALWKASKPGEPWWESPWGRGRPGWHIECSVMSQRYLGETFDIHGGGEDLIFPHHENEIAQSEGATGKPLARWWVHNGFVRVNSEKMSKSLGNFATIREMLKDWHPEVMRLFMISSHYRSPVDFSPSSLAEARSGMNRFYATLKLLKDMKGAMGEAAPEGRDTELAARLDELRGRFVEAMEDDFNTARALGYVFEAARTVNAHLGEVRPPGGGSAPAAVRAAEGFFSEIGGVLGLFGEDPDEYFRLDREREAAKRGLETGEIERLLHERREARAAKDWQRADEIRRRLAAWGIAIKDAPEGTTWHFA
ncbi:MAG TPA: cysteine--tRNA ligase [Syntrophales bacterium]|nr:cysteine--tRNA ligase [Syntrophales bacterium]HOM07772.1 cysteine--tRNA ligase [Syntrophales bacterium]HON99459.1 cysteine--tRNA ligase [Syntrophales bacterium]HPC00806.1 cysteine--tRNA ligase [Syntrophales bacterium]HRS86613.1 cysteine--tRNA ligase [Syntrophales bacterium]